MKKNNNNHRTRSFSGENEHFCTSPQALQLSVIKRETQFLHGFQGPNPAYLRTYFTQLLEMRSPAALACAAAGQGRAAAARLLPPPSQRHQRCPGPPCPWPGGRSPERLGQCFPSGLYGVAPFPFPLTSRFAAIPQVNFGLKHWFYSAYLGYG